MNRWTLLFCGALIASVAAQAGVEVEGDVVFRDNGYEVGVSEFGSLTVSAGIEVELNDIFIGLSPGADGQVLVTDPGTLVRLVGPGNRLNIGSGDGRITVRDGAVVDAASLPEDGSPHEGNFFFAGENFAEIIIMGHGSALRTINFFGIGSGGQAAVEVLDGAHLETGGVAVTDGPNSFGAVHVRGPGSQWTSDAILVGNFPGETALVAVEEGGLLVAQGEDGLIVGHGGGSGELIVAGGGRVVVGQGGLFASRFDGSEARILIRNGTAESLICADPCHHGWGIGSDGPVRMEIRDGSRVHNSAGGIGFAGSPAADVRVRIQGSHLEARDHIQFGEQGSCHVVLARGVIRAPSVGVGPRCRILGSGVIEGEVEVAEGGSVAPGIRIQPY